MENGLPAGYAMEHLVGGEVGGPITEADKLAVEALSAATLQGNVVYIGNELAKPWTRAWLTRAEGAPLGFLVAWHVADELHVLGVAVAEHVRREGLGRALMIQAQAYAARSAIRLVLLEVRRSNRAAIRLYRSLGFSAMGLRPGYYADREDAVEMMLVLDPETGEVVPSKDEIHLGD